MLKDNPVNCQVLFRTQELLEPDHKWNRRLWTVGTIMGLHGVLEASEAKSQSILSESAFKDLRGSLIRKVGPDPGAGDAAQRGAITELLKSDLEFGSIEYHRLKLDLELIERTYIDRWVDALRMGADAVERPARSISGYFLDIDFSGSYISNEIQMRLDDSHNTYTVADILDNLRSICLRPLSVFESIICFEQSPMSHRTKSSNWMSAKSAKTWLAANGFDSAELRIAGASRVTVEARDARRAAAKAKEHFQRLLARARVGSWVRCRPAGWIALSGLPEPTSLGENRGVACFSLHRNDLIYRDDGNPQLDNAIELLGTLNSGPRGPAVAAGWTAIESLLTVATDQGNRVIAATRAADLVACSFARAELTKLAHLYQKQNSDGLSAAIESAKDNREKARIVADHLASGGRLSLAWATDQAAEDRMRRLIANPWKGLADISMHIAVTLRRFYLARNLIVHGGHVDSRMADSLLRAASPLIGAAVDRVVAAVATEGISPMELVARASFAISHARSMDAVHVVDLLEPDTK